MRVAFEGVMTKTARNIAGHGGSALRCKRTPGQRSHYADLVHILTDGGPPTHRKMPPNDVWEGDMPHFRRPGNMQRRGRRGGSSVRGGRTSSRETCSNQDVQTKSIADSSVS